MGVEIWQDVSQYSIKLIHSQLHFWDVGLPHTPHHHIALRSVIVTNTDNGRYGVVVTIGVVGIDVVVVGRGRGAA